jgi:chromosome segregation ATPase
MGAEDVQKEIAALERELQRARHAAEKNQADLSALDEQRREREARLAEALRAQQDFERRLEEKRVEWALAAFNQAIADRDAAADAFASAVRLMTLRLQEFDAAQESAETAWQALLSGGTDAMPAAVVEQSRKDAQAQPGIVAEALATLFELVSRRSDQELERDLIEEAARSPLGSEIPNLPKHLQELARARYFAIARERRLK